MRTAGPGPFRATRRAAPGTAASAPAASPSPPPRWRIVVIDDHVPSRALVRAAVARAGGAVVAEADTAGAGLDLVARERPDAAVIAVGLPDGDGIDAAAEVERRYPCPVAGADEPRGPGRDRARPASAGAMAYLVKPLRPEELAPAVELAIARFAELARAGREAASSDARSRTARLIERAKGLLMDRLGLTEADRVPAAPEVRDGPAHADRGAGRARARRRGSQRGARTTLTASDPGSDAVADGAHAPEVTGARPHRSLRSPLALGGSREGACRHRADRVSLRLARRIVRRMAGRGRATTVRGAVAAR